MAENADKTEKATPQRRKKAREQGALRGFADRGNWKFREEDIDQAAAPAPPPTIRPARMKALTRPRSFAGIVEMAIASTLASWIDANTLWTKNASDSPHTCRAGSSTPPQVTTAA